MANITQMIADLDSQITSLQTARQALAEAHGIGSALPVGPRQTAVRHKLFGSPTKRTMSDEARRRIAAAQKKRWAAVNQAKAAPKKTVAIATPKKAVVRRPPVKKAAPPPTPTVETPTPEVVS